MREVVGPEVGCAEWHDMHPFSDFFAAMPPLGHSRWSLCCEHSGSQMLNAENRVLAAPGRLGYLREYQNTQRV